MPALSDLQWLLTLIAIVVGFLAAVEIGYRAGRARGKRAPREEQTHVTAIAGTLIGTLGLLLAFSLSMAEDRYQARKQLVLDEAQAIHSAWLRASFLPDAQRARSRDLLLEYLDVRLDIPRTRQVAAGVRESERLHDALWQSGVQASRAPGGPGLTGLYAGAIDEIVKTHRMRVHVYRNELPRPIVYLLFVVAHITMAVLGFGFGLANTRTLGGTAALVIALAATLSVVADLDARNQRLFQVNQDALVELRGLLARELGAPAR